MSKVSDLLAAKGGHVMSVGPEATVLDAATLMNDHGIGSLVVLDAGRVVGMFTERDVLRRVVSEQRDPAATRVGEVMTREVVCCTPETTADEAASAMKNRRIRHLPVCAADGTIVGIISIGDLNARVASEQEQTIHLMQEYLYGRV
jgi:CBS domain-containing protein